MLYALQLPQSGSCKLLTHYLMHPQPPWNTKRVQFHFVNVFKNSRTKKKKKKIQELSKNSMLAYEAYIVPGFVFY